MSGTVGERDVTRNSALLDRELAGLLADLAESPDFAAAESLLLKQFSEAAGFTRVALYLVDPTFHRLELRGSQGVISKSAPRSPLPLDDEGHPMTVAAIGQEV
ncbi:MAG TPA: hypothetical protein VFK39_16140, partial [Gemmatimonadaceae bacterium]|nr:hypothetical protein [Gemmatimonadaceae bacterium]